MTDPTHVAALVCQAGIGGALLAGAYRRDLSATVNAMAALGATLAPAAVEAALRSTAAGVDFDPTLTLWIAAAGFLHSLGMLGLYETVRWWDHLTHTVSAALVAALTYAGLLGVARHAPGVALSRAGVAGATVLLVFAAGLVWELVEVVARHVGERFDVDPVLVQYGPRDTALDLAFNLVGALLVVGLDVRVFVPLAERYPDPTTLVGLGAVTVVLAAVLGLVVGVAAGDDGWPTRG